MDDKKWLR
uniref:Uncharacterized protein n=1 Tax=Anguilla anguilla TaxID=7936 RepID=A0A0E9RX35_ANGAN